MTGQDAGRRGEEIKAALKKVGARNDPFARCSLCKKDWNGGEGHEHEADHAEAERDGDFLFIREEKGGRIWTDYDGMAKWVAAHVDTAVAEAVKERDAEIARLRAMSDEQKIQFRLAQEKIDQLRGLLAEARRRPRGRSDDKEE